MAMLSRALTQSTPRVNPWFSLTTLRHGSNKVNPQLVEVDLDSTAESTEVITVGMKKLEEAIHGIIVRRAAPDWLPFLPGYSYWVPPPQRSSPSPSSARGADAQNDRLIEIVGKLASASSSSSSNSLRSNRRWLSQDYFASDDEQGTISSSRGWPSSDFFTQDVSPLQPNPEMEVEMHIPDTEDDADDSHDEKE